MAEHIPKIRVGIDWDDDWFICWDAKPGDGVNLIPHPLTLHTVDKTCASGDIYQDGVITNWGLYGWRVNTGASFHNTLHIGRAADGTVNTIPVLPSTQYTLTLYVRQETYPATIFATVVDDLGANLSAPLISGAVAGWRKLTLTVNTGASSAYIYVAVSTTAFSAPGYVEGVPLFTVTGLSLFAGVSTAAFNAGSVPALYEDVTSTLLRATWELGKKDTTANIAAEGVATITLNNADRRYSPEYTSSPLYSKILENLRMVIEVQNPTTLEWVTMWSGYTRLPDVDAGRTTSNGFVTIRAEQGVFRLAQIPLNVSDLENVRFDELLDPLLENGWYSSNTPYMALLDRSRLDETFILSDIDLMREADTAINTFEYVGEGWVSGQTSPANAIKDVLDIEGGFLYLRRDGKLIWKNRYAYNLLDPADHELVIDTSANSGDYAFGAKVFNEVRVDVSPKSTDVREVWRTKQPIRVKGKTKSQTEIKFEYEDGEKLSVIALSDFGLGSTISAKTANHSPYSGGYEYSVELSNGAATLTINNLTPYNLYFTVVLEGTVLISSGSITVVQQDADSIAQSGVKNRTVNTKLITTEDDAINYAHYILLRFGRPRGAFSSITIITRNAEWLSRQLAMTVGTTVNVSEYQTGAANKPQLIIAENHNWTPGVLRSNYTLQALDPVNYWIVGASLLGDETHLGY